MPQDERGSGNAPALAVWCADREAAGPVLQALETRFDLAMQATLTEAGQAVQDGRDLVLLYEPLATILHRAADNDIAPQTVLPDWQARIRAILDLHRRNRRQVRLVDTSAARARPEALRTAFDLPRAPETARDDMSPDNDTLLGFLARHYLLDDPEGRALSLALEAASVVLAPAETGPGASHAAFQAYRRQREESGILRQQSRAMQEELTTLHRDRDTLSQTLESASEDARRAEERIAQLQSRGDTLEEELARARDDNNAQQEELAKAQETAATAKQAELQIELLQAQTRAMQEELEAMAARNHEMAEEVKALNQGVAHYQHRMAELRDHQDGLGRRLAAKDQNLRVAGQMITDLETYGRDQRQALTRQIQNHDRTRAALEAERDGLRAEMDHLLASRSFRLTAPLRRAMALFSRGGRS